MLKVAIAISLCLRLHEIPNPQILQFNTLREYHIGNSCLGLTTCLSDSFVKLLALGPAVGIFAMNCSETNIQM